MAAGTDACKGRVPVCLCVLCGLPAAGKSSVARMVGSAAAQLGWRAALLSYDDLIPEHAYMTAPEEDHAETHHMV